MVQQVIKEPVVAPTSEEFEQLLHHAYLIASETFCKANFFFQQERKVSSTLLLVDMLRNFNHPAFRARFGCQKKGKPCNNLLLLPVDTSWNQNFVKYEGEKLKAFQDWGSHAVHVSDLLTFRPSFFEKYNMEKFLSLCYDGSEEINQYKGLEFWYQRK